MKRGTAVLVREVVRQAPVRRVGIAGGDTSSEAVLELASLGLWGLTLCRAHAIDPALDGAEVMLKGGQMGGPDLFERLIHGDAG